MARLLGSVSDQRTWLFASGSRSPAFADSLIALIRGSDDFLGSLRLFGYRSLLMLQHLPGFDRRALSFADPVQEPEVSRLVGISDSKGVRNA